MALSKRTRLWPALCAVVFFLPSAAGAKPISIKNISDLDFGTAVAGDGSRTIPAGTAESMSNGSFEVSGDRNTSYTIVLPASIQLTTGAGGVSEQITVDGFDSYPAPGANGLLDNTGKQSLFIGARRSALPLSQSVGVYSGSYAITVVY